MDGSWYSVVDNDEIQQGDFFFNLDIPVVEDTKEVPPLVDMQLFDAIVMTQSRDIQKMNHLILCPVWKMNDVAKEHPDMASKGGMNNLRRERYVAFHLLDKCQLSGFESDYKVVGCERIFERPKTVIQELSAQQNSRLRLMSPYREHLAQAFARFFMRVGLPNDIPEFK